MSTASRLADLVGILALGAAACGGGSDGGADAQPDGAPPVDAAPRLETVRVLDRFVTPMAGVPVAYNDAAGEVVGEAVTDAAGEVMVDVPPGGSVTVFFTIGNQHQRQVITDLEDGQTVLVHRIGADFVEPPPVVIAAPTSYSFGLVSLPAQTASVTMNGPCNGHSVSVTPPTATIAFSDAECVYGTRTSWNALFFAKNAGGAVIAWGAAPGMVYNPGGTSSATGIAVNATTFDRFAAEPHGLVTYSRSWLGVTSLGPNAWPGGSALADNQAGTVAVVVTVPSSPSVFGFSGFALDAGYSFDDADGSRDFDVYTTVGASPTPGGLDVALDVDVDALAAISIPSDVDASTPGRLSLGFELNGPRGDVGTVGFAWWGPGHVDTDQAFVVFDPTRAGASPIRLPAVPVHLAAYAPAADAGILAGSVRLDDVEAITGYTAFLAERGANYRYRYVVGERVTSLSVGRYAH